MNRDHITLKFPKQEEDEEPDFKMYVMDISYFSGKLEAYFRYQGLRWERVEPTWSELGRIKQQSGTSQVPLVWDCKAQVWLRDSTYIIQHLEQEYPSKVSSSLPSQPVPAFLCLLLEDWADEYLWRPAMYYRWEPSLDSWQLPTRFSWEFLDTLGIPLSCLLPLPSCLCVALTRLRQRLYSVFGEGIFSQEQHRAVQSQYLSSLAILQPLLASNSFLLGTEKPTRADFGLFAPFFRHFSSDPTPRKILQQVAPAVLLWVARMWSCKKTDPGTGPECSNVPEAWHSLLPLVREYLEYLHSNALAWSRGQHSFMATFQGVQSEVQTVHYRVWCRLELQRWVLKLQEQEKEQCQEELEQDGEELDQAREELEQDGEELDQGEEELDQGEEEQEQDREELDQGEGELEDEREQEDEKELEETLESVLKSGGCWEILWRDGKIACSPEQGLEPPFCRPLAPSSLLQSPMDTLTPVDSPKWPILPLVRRFLLHHLPWLSLPLVVVALTILLLIIFLL